MKSVELKLMYKLQLNTILYMLIYSYTSKLSSYIVNNKKKRIIKITIRIDIIRMLVVFVKLILYFMNHIVFKNFKCRSHYFISFFFNVYFTQLFSISIFISYVSCTMLLIQ